MAKDTEKGVKGGEGDGKRRSGILYLANNYPHTVRQGGRGRTDCDPGGAVYQRRPAQQQRVLSMS